MHISFYKNNLLILLAYKCKLQINLNKQYWFYNILNKIFHINAVISKRCIKHLRFYNSMQKKCEISQSKNDITQEWTNIILNLVFKEVLCLRSKNQRTLERKMEEGYQWRVEEGQLLVEISKNEKWT